MPKWKKDAKEFTVAVYHNEASGCYTTAIPKPIIEHLGNGVGVEETTYKVRGSKVELARVSRTEGQGAKSGWLLFLMGVVLFLLGVLFSGYSECSPCLAPPANCSCPSYSGLPFGLALAVIGAVLMAFGVRSVRRERKEGETPSTATPHSQASTANLPEPARRLCQVDG